MKKQFEVTAFQIASMATHGAICSDDWGRNNPIELHSHFGAYVVIPAKWDRALLPKIGGWFILYPDGRWALRSEGAFENDYVHMGGHRYLTNWQPLFKGELTVNESTQARPAAPANSALPIVVCYEDWAYGNYLDNLSKILLLPITLQS